MSATLARAVRDIEKLREDAAAREELVDERCESLEARVLALEEHRSPLTKRPPLRHPPFPKILTEQLGLRPPSPVD